MCVCGPARVRARRRERGQRGPEASGGRGLLGPPLSVVAPSGARLRGRGRTPGTAGPGRPGRPSFQPKVKSSRALGHREGAAAGAPAAAGPPLPSPARARLPRAELGCRQAVGGPGRTVRRGWLGRRGRPGWGDARAARAGPGPGLWRRRRAGAGAGGRRRRSQRAERREEAEGGEEERQRQQHSLGMQQRRRWRRQQQQQQQQQRRRGLPCAPRPGRAAVEAAAPRAR